MPFAINSTLQGTPILRRFLSNAKRGAASPGPSLRRLAEEIKAKSVRIAPHETGKMKSTAFVRQLSRNEVEIGYGTKYALAVHEVPPSRARHKRPTQWKFLEKPAKARLNKTDDQIRRDPVLGKMIQFEKAV